VSGLIACLMSDNRITPNDIRYELDRLALDIDAVGYDSATFIGFATYLNAKAFDRLMPRKRL